MPLRLTELFTGKYSLKDEKGVIIWETVENPMCSLGSLQLDTDLIMSGGRDMGNQRESRGMPEA